MAVGALIAAGGVMLMPNESAKAVCALKTRVRSGDIIACPGQTTGHNYTVTTRGVTGSPIGSAFYRVGCGLANTDNNGFGVLAAFGYHEGAAKVDCGATPYPRPASVQCGDTPDCKCRNENCDSSCGCTRN